MQAVPAGQAGTGTNFTGKPTYQDLSRGVLAEPMNTKAAWQQANPFHNISNDEGRAPG